MRRTLLAGAILLALPTTAAAAPAALPSKAFTLTAAKAAKRSCATAPQAGRGLARATFRAPMSGFVSARLSGPATSDWDLVAVDRATGGRLAASSAFGSNELVQTWVAAGQRIGFVGCRRTGAARSVTLSVDQFDVKPPEGAGKVALVRVEGDDEQIEALEDAGLDVTHNRRAGWADVIVAGADDREILERAGLGSIVRVADMAAHQNRSRRADARYAARVGESPIPSGRTTYRTYEDFQSDLKKLVEGNPGLVRPVTIGRTFQGRDIQGVEIARGVRADDSRPTHFLMGMHHAREWPSAEAAIEYALMLTQGQGDPRIARLLDGSRTTVVPIVNVDGFVSTKTVGRASPNDNNPLGQNEDVHLVEAVAPPGGIFAYRRKNCAGAVPDGRFPCELQWGVDNNRNYGNLWGGPGSSQDPTSQSYHGPGPRSEPETQAVWDYGRQTNVTLMNTLHNVAALVLRPPGLSSGGKAPDEGRMKEIGDAMAAATKYVSQYSFQLYDTAGTTDDDFYASLAPFSFTIEIGPANGMFHMPYEVGFVRQWLEGDGGPGGLREALLISGEAAMNAADHSVLAGRSTPGATLRLRKAFDTVTSPFCDLGVDPVLTVGDIPPQASCPRGVQKPQTLKDSLEVSTAVPADGAYEWHVNPSTRPFVGGGALIQKLNETPSREDVFTGGGPGPDNIPAESVEDREFTITEDDGADAVKITLEWGTPEDYDLEVYRKAADGSLTKVGSSGKVPGVPEELVLSGDQAAPGTYVLRVINFAAAVAEWTAKIGRYRMTTTTTTGSPEAYVLTCEIGGNVVRSQELFIARGDRLEFDPCRSPAPPAGAPGKAGPGLTGSSAPPAKAAPNGSAEGKRARGKRANARIEFLGKRLRARRAVVRRGLAARVECATRCRATAVVKFGVTRIASAKRAGKGSFVLRVRMDPKRIRRLSEEQASRVRMVVTVRDGLPRPKKRAGGFIVRPAR